MSRPSSSESPDTEPQTGWSTKKKWVVGCGGCLGVVLIFAVICAVLASLGFNSLISMSNQAVAAIFGPSYKPKEYTAMGMPTAIQNFKNIAMLINYKAGDMVIAAQTELPADQAELVRSGKLQQLQAMLKQMINETEGQSRSDKGKVKSVRFNQTYNLKLTPNQTYTVCNATIEMEGKGGAIAYLPISTAFLPEDNNGLVVLVAMNPYHKNSADPNANFDAIQKEMQEQVLQIIKDSELDDRLSVSSVSSKPAQINTSKRVETVVKRSVTHTY